MNEEKDVSDDWSIVVEKIKLRFQKLSNENIVSLNGSLDLLTSKLESVYGYAKHEAEKEFENFKAALHSSSNPKQ